MKLKTILFLILLFLLSNFVSAVCTVTTDKTTYSPGETVTATMICTSGAESNKAYTLTWTNGTDTVETDIGTTPAGTNIPFFETLVTNVNDNWINANVTLTGTNLEGSATFNVTGNSTNILIISDLKFSPVAMLGEIFALDFKVSDSSGNDIDNAHCTIYGTDNNDAPLQECSGNRYVETINGRGLCSDILDPKALEESTPYLAKIRCHCKSGDNGCFDQDGNIIEYKSGETSENFEISPWLTSINTLTDKSDYTVDDDLLICVNITNPSTERLPLNIVYGWRCQNGGGDLSFDRILIGTKEEERGIDANTSQYQCAKFRIPDEVVIEKGANNCYASTSVTVLDESKEPLVTYDTTSSIFIINTTHVHPIIEWKHVSQKIYKAEFTLNKFNVGVKDIEIILNPKITNDFTPATTIESYTITYENGSVIPYEVELEIEREFRDGNDEDVIAFFIEDVNTTLNEEFKLQVNFSLTDTGESMSWMAIIISLSIMTIIFGICAFMIKDPLLKPIKTIFFILFVVNGLMLGILSYIISVNGNNVTAFQPLGLGYATINVILILGFMWNYLFARFSEIYQRSTKKMSFRDNMRGKK